MADLPQPVLKAVSELARDQHLSPAEVKVVEWKRVEWRDTSLGCPEPGMMYAQVITPGYLVLLQADGRTFEYHTDTTGNVVTCADPQPPLSGGS